MSLGLFNARESPNFKKQKQSSTSGELIGEFKILFNHNHVRRFELRIQCVKESQDGSSEESTLSMYRMHLLVDKCAVELQCVIMM